MKRVILISEKAPVRRIIALQMVVKSSQFAQMTHAREKMANARPEKIMIVIVRNHRAQISKSTPSGVVCAEARVLMENVKECVVFLSCLVCSMLTKRIEQDPEDDNNWQDCDCSDDPDWSLNPTPQRVRPDAKKHRQALANTPDIEYPPDPLPDAKCDQTKSSQVPYNVFSPGVYSNFCNDVDQDKSKALTETLDSSSKVIQGASKEKRDVSKRTPPPNPGTYKDYNFTLSWSGGDKSCPYNCSDVFYKIAQGPCGRTAGEQNIMASSASLDTGCGIYSYNITTPAPPSSPSPSPSVNCHSGSTPGGYVQFSRDAASDMVNEICTELVDSKVVLSQSGSSLPPASMNDIFQKSGNNVAANGATLVINPHWALGGCADQNNPQDVDFGSMPINDCAGYFMTAIDGCPEFDNPSGTQFWKWGGTNQAACAFWSVQAG